MFARKLGRGGCRQAARIARIAGVVLLLLGVARCAGGYDGPVETQFSAEHSHGHP